jgi:hypothetical protein
MQRPICLLTIVLFVVFVVVPSTLALAADEVLFHLSPSIPLPSEWDVRADLAEQTEIPGAWIYDPLQQTSHAITKSWKCVAGDKPLLQLKQPLKLSGSFTVECFLKPDAAVEAIAVGQPRRMTDAAEWRIGLDPFRAHNQWYFRAAVASPGGQREGIRTGYYGSPAQWRGDGDDYGWRHVALVWDAERKVATSWVDHYLSASVAAESLTQIDDSPFVIGGAGFCGLIGDVRLTAAVLGPENFLRTAATELRGVSFASQQSIVPADSGALDVKRHFGAVGDGVVDDSDAFQRAFDRLTSRVPLAYHTLLIPEGHYRIARPLHCSRFIDVKGAGPDRTILQLPDGVFTNPDDPQPVLRMSSTSGPPGSNQGTNGSSICLYLDGITIDTGRNNPGAKALEYHSNNIGRLENVVLRSGDGQGVIGLDLTHHDVGPALVKNVTVDGFREGVAIRYQEYSMTFEHLTLRNQSVAGIRNQGNILAIRGLQSRNAVPAIICEGANSMLTLLDSTLTGTDTGSDVPAIRAAGAVYVLRVQTPGYSTAIENSRRADATGDRELTERIPGPQINEFIGDRIVTGFGESDGALKLPIDETPDPPLPPVSEWVSIDRFAEQATDGDWSLALQAAIDSGARVLYLPTSTRRKFKSPVKLHGAVERIMGFGQELNWDESAWKPSHQREQLDDSSAPPPLLIFDGDVRQTVVLDRLSVQSLQHASGGTLVLRSSSCDRYSTAQPGGRLFIEDAGGADWHFDHPQQVWVRQWNPESHAAGPCIQNRGATLWVLGFKTEYESEKLAASNGARTEILGSFIYPLGEIPPDRPIFRNRDSDMALVYGLSVYHANHKVHILDERTTTGGAIEGRTYTSEDYLWAGSRARMDLFATRSRRRP